MTPRLLGLLILLCLPPAWGADAGMHEECIAEPIFEGKVCTLQANRDARTGVILIHGLGGSIADWKNTLPALSADFHVVAFDLPGFGQSDKGSRHYSPTLYAHLAHFLADRYFPDKPYHIVGHSMGGAIALRFAAQRPLRFQRLVLIDAAGILHPQVLSKFQAGSFIEGRSGVKQTRGVAERVSGSILERVGKLPFLPTDIVNSALGRDVVLQGAPERIAALELAAEDFSRAIPTVTEPTLVLWGDNDPTVPLRTGHVLAARLPQARLIVIPDAQHVPMDDQPETLNAHVRRHLLASAQALAEQYRPAPQQAALNSERIATCSGESGKVFEGDYASIELRDCSDITIRNARVGRLDAVNSRVTLIDTDIPGKASGLHADNSDITVTNGEITGDIAINAVRSRLDLAGVHLRGAQAAVKGLNSKIAFSICHATSPHMDGPLHTFKDMGNEEL